MTPTRRIFVISILFAALGAFHSKAGYGQEAAQTPLERLKTSAPSATWDENTSVNADVTCDGVEDVVMLGNEKDIAWIGVVPGSSEGQSHPILSKFPIGAGSQDSFCAQPVQIKTTDIYCDTGEGFELPGCRPVNGCKNFSVIDTCDSFHFYWDNDHDRLRYWRR